MAKKSDLSGLLRADKARAETLTRGRRGRGNNPYGSPVEPLRHKYVDTMADQVVANVMRERRAA